MLRHVDLCSGIGGFALGFQWAGLSVPVLFCDKDQFCQRVLAKHWPDVPIAGDVEELSLAPNRFVPDCDIITAGYPCQPFSIAGKRKGEADDRHIWPFILKIVAQKRPTFCVFENVYGHVSMGLDQVLFDLEAQNYSSRTFIVPACGVDAPHKRDRVWIIAQSNSQGETNGTKHEQRMVGYTEHNGSSASKVARGIEEAGKGGTQGQVNAIEPERASRPSDGRGLEAGTARTNNVGNSSGGRLPRVDRRGAGKKPANGCEDVADPNSERPQGGLHWRQDTEWQGEHGQSGCSSPVHRQPAKDWWAVEPSVGRVAYGIPNRVHRLRALGNAIVPQIAQQIGETIKAIHYGDH